MQEQLLEQLVYDITGDFLEFRANNTSGIGGGIAVVDQNYASHIPGNTTANHWGPGIYSNSSSHWVNGDPTNAIVKSSMLWFSGSNVYHYNIEGRLQVVQVFWYMLVLLERFLLLD